MWGATPVTESVAAHRDPAHRRALPARLRRQRAPGARLQPGRATRRAWRLDSAGLPPAEVELRVVDLDTGDVLEPGGIGEIQARSPSLMAGYLPDDANADAFDDGWYRTGDVGWLEPEGWVHLTDRSKEMIKVNGFQVAPAEIEAVLHGHPAVLDCAVFGIADERAGEVPVAAVQLDPAHAGRRRRARAAGGRLARHLQAPAPPRRGRRHPAAARRARCCAAPSATSGPRSSPRPGRLMDVRLSPEQRALRDSAAQVVDRLGPQAVGQLDDDERAAKLDAAVERGRLARAPDRRRRTAGRWPPAWRRPSSPRSSGRGLADAAVPRTDPGRRPAPARRRAAGRGRRDRRARRRPRRAGRPPSTARRPPGRVAIDAQGASSALLLVPDGRRARARPGRRYGAGDARVDLTRPTAAVRPRRPPSTPCPTSSGCSPTTTSTAWTALGLALTCADLVGHDARRGRPRLRVRQGAPAVRQPDRLVPGRAAPPRRRLRGHGGLAQRRPPRGVGGRRPRARTTRSPAAALAKAYSAAGRPHGVRDRHPGARRHRQHLGVPRPRAPPPGPAVDRRARRRRRRASTACSPTTGSEAAVDFGDSPDEAAFRAPAARLAPRTTTRACPRRRPTDDYWAGAAAWHQALYDAGFFAHVVADGDRRARACRPSTR